MSPQQLDGERGTPLDDIYSVGASIYELLTSKPPFCSGNIDRQVREKVPPPMTQRRQELEIEGNSIDVRWEQVVGACLANDPAMRPQSVSEIADQLEVPLPKTHRATHRESSGNKQAQTFGTTSSRKLLGPGLKVAVSVSFIALASAAAAWFFTRQSIRPNPLHIASQQTPDAVKPVPTTKPKPSAASVPAGATAVAALPSPVLSATT
jgi:serine/threonine protein kinase